MQDFYLKFNRNVNRAVGDHAIRFALNGIEFSVLNFHKSVPDPDVFIEEHEHPFSTIDIIESGSMTTFVDDMPIRSVPAMKTLLFLPDLLLHSRRFGKDGPHRATLIGIQIHAPGAEQKIAEIAARHFYQFPIDPALETLWDEIAMQGENETGAAIPVLRTLITAYLMLFFQKNFSELFGTETPQFSPAIRESRIGTIKRLLFFKIRDADAVPEIARLFKLSIRHLNRVFAKGTGMTVKAYQSKLRFETAQKLLVDTDLPIAEIGKSVGYRSPNLFSTFFRRQAHCTPQEFRKRCKLPQEPEE